MPTRPRVPSPRTRSTRAPAPRSATSPGTATAGAIVGATWTAGRYGSALSFNGTNARVDLPALGTFYKTGFTLEAWVKQERDRQGRRHRRHLGRAPDGGPMLWVDHIAGHSPRDVQRRPVQLPRLGHRRPPPASGSTSAPRTTARPPGTTSTETQVATRDVHRQRRRLEHLADRGVRRHSLRVLQGSHRRRAHLQPRADRGRGAVGHERAGRVRHGARRRAHRLRQDRREGLRRSPRAGPRRPTTSASPATACSGAATQVATTTSTSYTFTDSRAARARPRSRGVR